MTDWRPGKCESRSDCHYVHSVANKQKAHIAKLENYPAAQRIAELEARIAKLEEQLHLQMISEAESNDRIAELEADVKAAHEDADMHAMTKGWLYVRTVELEEAIQEHRLDTGDYWIKRDQDLWSVLEDSDE